MRCAALLALVTSLVSSIITPLVAAVGGKPDFSSLAFTINESRFTYGSFINALLTTYVMEMLWVLWASTFIIAASRERRRQDRPSTVVVSVPT